MDLFAFSLNPPTEWSSGESAHIFFIPWTFVPTSRRSEWLFYQTGSQSESIWRRRCANSLTTTAAHCCVGSTEADTWPQSVLVSSCSCTELSPPSLLTPEILLSSFGTGHYLHSTSCISTPRGTVCFAPRLCSLSGATRVSTLKDEVGQEDSSSFYNMNMLSALSQCIIYTRAAQLTAILQRYKPYFRVWGWKKKFFPWPLGSVSLKH